jgi:hypothetical protein
MNLTGTLARRTATLVLSLEERLARCATPMSKWTLFNAMAGKGHNPISINGIAVTLSSIQREDGSGSSFNLLVYGPDNRVYKCYCRTTE